MACRCAGLRACAAKRGGPWGTVAVAVLTSLLSVVVLTPTPAMAQAGHVACLQEATGLINPACAANDVRLVKLEAVGEPTFRVCNPFINTTVLLKATIESRLGRYDIGLWLNQFGGSAQSDPGSDHCYRNFLQPLGTSTACNQSGGPYYDADSDACGDVYASNTNPCGNAVTVPCTDGSGGTCLLTTIVFESTILCTGFGALAGVSVCTSWNNSDSTVCDGVLDTDPLTGANCNCTTVEILGLQVGVTCVTDADCDDFPNTCNEDRCTQVASDRFACFHPNDCDDGNACTVDDCIPFQHCTSHDNSFRCDDGLFCNGVETCDPTFGCRRGTPPNCDDGVACTVDACNEESDRCDHTPDHAACSDGDACTTDICDAVSGCTHTATVCNDFDACTTDSCDRTTGCVYTAISCNDSNECTDDTCNPAVGCVFVPDNSNFCDDGDPCTIEGCESGACVVSGPACADGDRCTADSCDPVTGACSHDFVCEGICRTAGFWGNRFNMTDAVIDAAGGCLEVCGQSICGTTDVDLQNTLGSALEALCAPTKGTRVGQTYRQIVTAALNCIVSGVGGNCGDLLDAVLDGEVHGLEVNWQNCNAQCALGGAGDTDLLSQCGEQLDCWNNGHHWGDLDPTAAVHLGCATGTCEDAPHNYCRETPVGGVIGSQGCRNYDIRCVPFDVSCHTRSLCTSPVAGLFAGQCAGGFENLGPAHPQHCKTARDSECVYGKPGSCDEPNPCLDEPSCNRRTGRQ
jgi:hypothetical protein